MLLMKGPMDPDRCVLVQIDMGCETRFDRRRRTRYPPADNIGRETSMQDEDPATEQNSAMPNAALTV
jgi:hypothetical protein